MYLEGAFPSIKKLVITSYFNNMEVGVQTLMKLKKKKKTAYNIFGCLYMQFLYKYAAPCPKIQVQAMGCVLLTVAFTIEKFYL